MKSPRGRGGAAANRKFRFLKYTPDRLDLADKRLPESRHQSMVRDRGIVFVSGEFLPQGAIFACGAPYKQHHDEGHRQEPQPEPSMSAAPGNPSSVPTYIGWRTTV